MSLSIYLSILVLTIYALTSAFIFSKLFSVHLQGADKENLSNNQEFL